MAQPILGIGLEEDQRTGLWVNKIWWEQEVWDFADLQEAGGGGQVVIG